MIRKKFAQSVMIGIGVCLISCVGYIQNVDAATEVHQQVIFIESYYNNQLQPFSSKLIWRYKTENRKTYRRLYDAGRGKWLTDWILCD